MNLESSKNLGGIGALLMFIGILPFANFYGIIELVGVILVFAALYNLARYYKESGIFNNAVYGLFVGIVGGVISAAVVIFTVITSLTDFIYKIYPGWNGDWTALSGLTPTTTNITLSDIVPFVEGIIIVFLVVWIFSIIATFFIRRSLKLLSAKSNVGLISTSGTLMLVGAVLIIIFGIGLILMWIALLILAIAFFMIKPSGQPAAPAPVAPVPPPTPV